MKEKSYFTPDENVSHSMDANDNFHFAAEISDQYYVLVAAVHALAQALEFPLFQSINQM